jgi:hypothetical protein
MKLQQTNWRCSRNTQSSISAYLLENNFGFEKARYIYHSINLCKANFASVSLMCVLNKIVFIFSLISYMKICKLKNKKQIV